MTTSSLDQTTTDFLSMVDADRMIRRVEPSDWKEQWAIHMEALQIDPDPFKGNYDYCSSIPEQAAKEHTAKMASSPTEASFLAWAGNKSIGEVIVHLPNPGTATISHLWVRPEYRQENIGTRLMDMAETWALDQGPGLTHFDLLVQPGNLGVVMFYEKLGYKVSMVKVGEEIVMNKPA